jgi:polyphosphate glucokinase
VTIGTGLGSGVFYDGQLIPNFKLGHLLWKEGKVIEKYAVDSVRKQENLEFDKWGERLRYYSCRRKCC